jgi:UDP-N-acetylglucosamine acyltransferase
MRRIHPTAVIDARAELAEDVDIGPYCLILGAVTLGAGCWLQGHVVMDGPTVIGAGNKFHAFCSIGQRTQDLKYQHEPTRLRIGDNNNFRECCTVNRATMPDADTIVGSGGNFLAYSHIAHDCRVGDNVIFSNNGTIAGHVEVGNHAVIGGLTAVHQFCRIGRHAITGGCSKIVQDVPPFMIADGNPAEVRGINKVGMERAGFPSETLRALTEAYRIIYRSNLNTSQACEKLESEFGDCREVCELREFIQSSQRGITR